MPTAPAPPVKRAELELLLRGRESSSAPGVPALRMLKSDGERSVRCMPPGVPPMLPERGASCGGSSECRSGGEACGPRMGGPGAGERRGAVDAALPPLERRTSGACSSELSMSAMLALRDARPPGGAGACCAALARKESALGVRERGRE